MLRSTENKRFFRARFFRARLQLKITSAPPKRSSIIKGQQSPVRISESSRRVSREAHSRSRAYFAHTHTPLTLHSRACEAVSTGTARDRHEHASCHESFDEVAAEFNRRVHSSFSVALRFASHESAHGAHRFSILSIATELGRFHLTLPLGGPNPCMCIQPTAPRVTCSAHGRTLLVALRCAWLAGSGPSSSRRFSKA